MAAAMWRSLKSSYERLRMPLSEPQQSQARQMRAAVPDQ